MSEYSSDDEKAPKTQPPKEEEEEKPKATMTPETEELPQKPAKKKKSSKKFKRSGSTHSQYSDMDEATRERFHLIESNTKMREQIRELKSTLKSLRVQREGAASESDQKQIVLLREQNHQYEADIAAYKEKLGDVLCKELMDDLIDEVQQKRIQLKALELQRRTLEDAERTDAKLLHSNEMMPSRAKVFLDLKEQRNVYKLRVEKLRSQLEHVVAHTELVQKRADAEEKAAAESGILPFDIKEITDLKAQDAEQQKQITKMKAQIGILNETMTLPQTQLAWMTRDKEDQVDMLREKIKFVEAQILQKEQMVMANNGWSEAPVHFLKAGGLDLSTPAAPSSASTSKKPKPPPKEPTPPKEPKVAKKKKEKKKPEEPSQQTTTTAAKREATPPSVPRSNPSSRNSRLNDLADSPTNEEQQQPQPPPQQPPAKEEGLTPTEEESAKQVPPPSDEEDKKKDDYDHDDFEEEPVDNAPEPAPVTPPKKPLDSNEPVEEEYPDDTEPEPETKKPVEEEYPDDTEPEPETKKEEQRPSFLDD